MEVLIIEDDLALGKRLKRMIQQIDSNLMIFGPLSSVKATNDWIERNGLPDLLFLDIHLEDGLSFELFKQRKIDRPVIITSGDDTYALKAYAFHTLDYLLKPFSKDRLQKAWEKYCTWKSEVLKEKRQTAHSPAIKPCKHKRLLVRKGKSMKLIDFCQVVCFFMQEKIVYAFTQSGEKYPVDYCLEKLEKMLDSNLFFRINRQAIINIEAIEDMCTVSKSRVSITLNPLLHFETVVSTDRSPRFRKCLLGEQVN